jgi:hypothetical protein
MSIQESNRFIVVSDSKVVLQDIIAELLDSKTTNTELNDAEIFAISILSH